MCHINIELKDHTVRPGSEVLGTLKIDFPTGLTAVKQIKLELIGVSGFKDAGHPRYSIPFPSSVISYDEATVLKKFGANTTPFDRSTRLFYDARSVYPPSTLLDDAQKFEEAVGRANYAAGSSIREDFKFKLTTNPLEVPDSLYHPRVSPLLGPPSKHAGSLPPDTNTQPGNTVRMPLPPSFMAETALSLNYAIVQYYLYVTVKAGNGNFEKKFPLKMLEVERIQEKPVDDEYKWCTQEVFNRSSGWRQRQHKWGRLLGFAVPPKVSRVVTLTHMPSGRSLKPGQIVTPKVYIFTDEMPAQSDFCIWGSCAKFVECTSLVYEDPGRRYTGTYDWDVVRDRRALTYTFKALSSDPELRSSTMEVPLLKGLRFYADVSESFPTFTVPVPKGPSVIDINITHSYSVHLCANIHLEWFGFTFELFKELVLAPVDSKGREDPRVRARLLEVPKVFWVLGLG